MKKRFIYVICSLLLLVLVLGGVWIGPRYMATQYFRYREDIVLDTYSNCFLRVLEIRKSVTNKDVAWLRWARNCDIYPLTHLSFGCVEFNNTDPIPEITGLVNLSIIGDPHKISVMDETSLANLLRGKKLELVAFNDTSFPEKLLETAPRYQFKCVFLANVPLSDADFDKLFSLQETESLFLISVPITQKTIEKIIAEGAHLKCIYLWGVPLEKFNLEKLKSLKSLEAINLKDETEIQNIRSTETFPQ